MLEKLWEILKHPLVAVIVIGAIMFTLGAVGIFPWPIGGPSVQVIDSIGRIGLGVMGAILICSSLLLLIRERWFTAVNQPQKGTADKSFFIMTYPQSQHAALFTEIDKLIPRAREVTLIATGLNLIWEKHIADLLIERAKSGRAKITICMGNPFSPHVRDRLVEEEMTGERAPVGRDGIERNTKALLQRLALEGNPPAFSICLFEHYPTFATLMFDKDIFIYPYAYQLLGNDSPIFHFRNDGSEEARFFISNAARVIRDAVPAKDVIAAHTDRKFYSEDWIAAAVYIVPDSREPLYQFGSSIIGYDIWREMAAEANKQITPEMRTYVGEAVEYGFHVTLADALYFVTEAEVSRIKAELRTLTEQFPPIVLSNLRIADRFDDMGAIVVLFDEESGMSESLHHELVARVYGSAISSNYLTSRTQRPVSPTAGGRNLLMTQRYGAPYILKRFEPHFTLCSIPPADPTVRNELVNRLQVAFRDAVPTKEVQIDAVCLLLKRKGDQYWKVSAKYPLCGK